MRQSKMNETHMRDIWDLSPGDVGDVLVVDHDRGYPCEEHEEPVRVLALRDGGMVLRFKLI